MNNAVDIRMRLEDIVEPRFISDIELEKLWPLAADDLNAIDDLFRRVVEIICNNDLVICFEKGKSSERAYVAGPAAMLRQLAARLECTQRGLFETLTP